MNEVNDNSDWVTVEYVPEEILDQKSLFLTFTKDKKLAIQCPTWEAKDEKKLNMNALEPGWFLYDLNLSGEQKSVYIHSAFKKDFKNDPVTALRDIGAFPTTSGSFFYSNKTNIVNNANKDRINPETGRGVFREDFKGDTEFQYFIHVDLGLKHDSTAIAMCHVDGKFEKNSKFFPKVVVDLIYEMNPKDYGGEIYIHNVRKFICDLRDVQKFNITHVSFDSFQSSDSQQLLSLDGFTTNTVSVDRSPYPHQNLKEAINLTEPENNFYALDYYYHEKLFFELENLVYAKNGTPDHTAGSSKDLADSLAGCLFNIYKYEEERLNNFTIFEVFDGF